MLGTENILKRERKEYFPTIYHEGSHLTFSEYALRITSQWLCLDTWRLAFPVRRSKDFLYILNCLRRAVKIVRYERPWTRLTVNNAPAVFTEGFSFRRLTVDVNLIAIFQCMATENAECFSSCNQGASVNGCDFFCGMNPVERLKVVWRLFCLLFPH